jgi:bacillithiol biosynthesis cysteine-adding enzyme BshC
LKKHVDIKKTKVYSDFVFDFLNENKTLKNFFNLSFDIKNFKKQIEMKKSFQLSKRNILVKELLSQYSDIDDKKVLNNINLLSKESTFTVTTGHQLSILTGPIFFIYKIISIINLCVKLKKEYPKNNFLPVFWLASEDHDFEEISEVYFRDKKINYSTKNKGSVGRMKLDEFKAFLDQIFKFFPKNNLAKRIQKIITSVYKEEFTLAAATRNLVHQLFGDKGLIIIDPDSHNLKKVFSSYMKDELISNTCEDCVNKTIKSIKEGYSEKYTPQVNPREINLFHLKTNLRERIIRKDSKYILSNKKLSQNEMLKELKKSPENFSPNVLMRPLYQEVVLPNLCYIGGPSEISYWLQLKNFFDYHGVVFPIINPRASVLLITPKMRRKINKYFIKENEIFLNKNDFINLNIKKHSDFDINLDYLKIALKKQFNDLNDLVEKTDSSFLGAVNAQKKKQFNGIDKLEKRLLKAQKRKMSFIENDLKNLYGEIYPDTIFQERKINFIDIYVHYGDTFFKNLFNKIDLFEKKFLLIDLK